MSKKIHIFLIFSWKQRYLVAYIGKDNKSFELQKVAWKVNLSQYCFKSAKWTNLDIYNTLKPSWQTVVVSCLWALKVHTNVNHTHYMLRLCLIKFLSAHILQRGKGLVNYEGREREGEDLCNYSVRTVNYTLHYLRLSHWFYWVWLSPHRRWEQVI